MVVAEKHGVELFDLQALNTEVQGYCTFIQYNLVDWPVPFQISKAPAIDTNTITLDIL